MDINDVADYLVTKEGFLDLSAKELLKNIMEEKQAYSKEIKEAENSSTTSKRLKELSKHVSLNVVEAVAKNPHTDNKTLRSIGQRNRIYFHLIRAIIENPTASNKTIFALDSGTFALHMCDLDHRFTGKQLEMYKEMRYNFKGSYKSFLALIEVIEIKPSF